MMNHVLPTLLFCLACQICHGQTTTSSEDLVKAVSAVRFATFNISFNRKSAGALKAELAAGQSRNPKRIAEILQRVRPDVILLNEFDYDDAGEGISNFLRNYLSVSQNGQSPIDYPHVFYQSVNTGIDTGIDVDNDGTLGTANDAFGFGNFPGQYGMVVLSKFEIDRDNVRTFQKFLWKDMPGMLWPMQPGSESPYYKDSVKAVFRLSSKSHWDVPIKVGEKTIHLIAAHPTPPVFDQEEDRNGRRNHDEIRFIADYVTPGKAKYIYDDRGKFGGLADGARFVIVGDMNADESDGDSSLDAAKLLTRHPLINHEKIPASRGGSFFAAKQGGVNADHSGDPALDTGDFNDARVGNLRLDYCLPSKTLRIIKSGVFWPQPGDPGADLVGATDHRLVWIDVEK